MGFRPEVENFQPYYAWHPRFEDDLRVGAQILEEFNHLYHDKEERAAVAKANEKAAAAAASEKVGPSPVVSIITRVNECLSL